MFYDTESTENAPIDISLGIISLQQTGFVVKEDRCQRLQTCNYEREYNPSLKIQLCHWMCWVKSKKKQAQALLRPYNKSCSINVC